MKLHDQLKSLGSGATTYNYDKPDSALLEAFPSPFAAVELNPAGAVGTLHIECPEFTCLCPMTGQPDFGKIVIDYQPDQLCVESKSLKLYLGSFRMHGEFHEAVQAEGQLLGGRAATYLRPTQQPMPTQL